METQGDAVQALRQTADYFRFLLDDVRDTAQARRPARGVASVTAQDTRGTATRHQSAAIIEEWGFPWDASLPRSTTRCGSG